MTFEHYSDRVSNQNCIELFNMGAASRDAEIESLRQKLEASHKREVMLRDVMQEVLDAVWLKTSHELASKFSNAVAATDDLKGLRLCHAEPYAFVYEYQGQGPRLSFELQDPKIPVAYYWQEKLFIAWNPKEQGK